MAAAPQPDPQAAGGAPEQGGAPAPAQPSQAPANPQQVMLAQMYQVCKRLALENPIMSGGMEKAAQGIQEAQTALVTQPKPQPAGQTPPF